MTEVYLIYQNRMFRDAVHAILRTQPTIKLLGASDSPDCAATDIAALSPGVVLLEYSQDRPPIHDMHRILSGPTPRLITLRLDQDGMHVWSQTWRETVGPDDLVEAIVTSGENC